MISKSSSTYQTILTSRNLPLSWFQFFPYYYFTQKSNIANCKLVIIRTAPPNSVIFQQISLMQNTHLRGIIAKAEDCVQLFFTLKTKGLRRKQLKNNLHWQKYFPGTFLGFRTSSSPSSAEHQLELEKRI